MSNSILIGVNDLLGVRMMRLILKSFTNIICVLWDSPVVVPTSILICANDLLGVRMMRLILKSFTIIIVCDGKIRLWCPRHRTGVFNMGTDLSCPGLELGGADLGLAVAPVVIEPNAVEVWPY